MSNAQGKRPIRFAIIGCGGYAGHHAHRLVKHPEAALVACCDLSADVIADFLGRHVPDLSPPPAAFIDVRAMLAQAKPEAVIIATPHTLHYEHAVAALDAGCHVYVEKPMVTRAADARDLQRRVAQARRILVIGYNTTCTPEFDYLRRVRADPHGPIGLGELHAVSATVSQNWMRWCDETWRQDPALSGGGFAYDTGAHLLHSLCWTVASHVREVYAHVDTRGRKVDINSAVTVRFENGVMATLTLVGDCAAPSCRMTCLFAGGRIDIDGWYGNWIEVHNAYGPVKYPKVNTDLPGQHPLENFIDAIRGRDQPRTNPEHGVIQCELMDTIYESARTGQPARPKRATIAHADAPRDAD